MSEKREGWLGWERLGCGITRADEVPPPINDDVEYSWVQPLDPDGPKPGETWEDCGGHAVEILHPAVITQEGKVESWWVKPPAYTMPVIRRDLSPITPTRTVTVELTEEEVAELKSPRFFGGSALRKLAEALEDS